MRIRLLTARGLGVTVCLMTAISAAIPVVNIPLANSISSKLSPHQSAGSVNDRRSPFFLSQMSWLNALLIQSAGAQPQPLRRINTSELSEQVYQQLPDFPRENQYFSSETGQVATENTLASRIIRYHLYIQERPTNFRLDWKLTLADYLGSFERMRPDNYPDYGLQDNPMAADIAAIESLTPGMRDRLVNTLYETFTANP